MPFGFHLAMDTLPSREPQGAAPGPPWLFPAFAFVPVWVSPYLRPFPGPRGITPAFGYSAPHSSAEGTSTPMSSMLLSTHYRPLRFPLGRSTVIDSRPALVPHHPGGPPRFLDRSVLARCLQPPRGSDPVLAHCCFASRTVSGFILVGGLADPYFHNEAESSSLALRLASSSTRGFSLSGFPSDCSLTTC